ncbi:MULTISPECIES: thioredoxin-disulfide reductase [Streptomyces]|uniref:Thioredoxin reductase n=1 Tax=Streptomyces venezuelae (strain ATCC 10712 / CBS 650.69 / DSM 40230 / JCM 4526 / NBRC 13096 / PD 04745) TaxID=953739 RepID=F2RD56_STRVP|nr:thioredoxin-disulfide reductase [Streptomyces venezuelae]APE22726.1 thioredoxin-disulfide reductase [Streptomyces venezuelae]QES00103.1 thioredoxin-disulfide reductase [Streptomyces venezuelae ATCC 10712]QES07154.1 thioredoxin-disulfide reductase [Streptomyces venezuelae]QES14132.1 thioredoxin-disulfide reductase [Streptomyces venezuelae]CCA56952.1 Thioredoxin reductase [Streptomyces venezuelae ATCC 10712]
MSDVRNVIIIGSGPAGYTAALYTARASLNPLVFEGAVTAGGALMNTTEVENFPGFRDGIMGPDLMDNMRAQAERFGAELVPDDVIAVDLTGEIKTVTDTAGTVHRAKAVIVTTGSQHRKLGLPNEDTLSGRGVSWCATCDGFFFKDQDIAVVGGGDTAIEEATFLSRFAKSVTIVHRRDTLRASKAMQERAFADPKISFAWDSEVTEIHGDQKLSGVTLRDTKTGETRALPVTGLFIAVGHDPRTELFKGQLDLDEEGYLKVAAPSTRTNLTGVFGAGDVVDHTYRQAITAAGTGCSAALDAERFLAALADSEKLAETPAV